MKLNSENVVDAIAKYVTLYELDRRILMSIIDVSITIYDRYDGWVTMLDAQAYCGETLEAFCMVTNGLEERGILLKHGGIIDDGTEIYRVPIQFHRSPCGYYRDGTMVDQLVVENGVHVWVR